MAGIPLKEGKNDQLGVKHVEVFSCLTPWSKQLPQRTLSILCTGPSPHPVEGVQGPATLSVSSDNFAAQSYNNPNLSFLKHSMNSHILSHCLTSLLSVLLYLVKSASFCKVHLNMPSLKSILRPFLTPKSK